MPRTSSGGPRCGRSRWTTDSPPEHPFPAAIDGVAAFRSLLDGGVDPASIVFAGDSAGGELTVTACLAARDAGLPLPAAVVAFAPGLDHMRSGATMSTMEGVDPFLTKDGLRPADEMYLGGADPDQCSPARRHRLDVVYYVTHYA